MVAGGGACRNAVAVVRWRGGVGLRTAVAYAFFVVC